MKTESKNASFLSTSRTWCARIARSRMTVAFFLFMLANCATQTTLHMLFFLSFTHGRSVMKHAVDTAGVRRGFSIFHNGIMEICYGIPGTHGSACHVVYNASIALPPPPPFRPPLAGLSSIRCMEGLTWAENYLRDSRSEEIVYILLQSWIFVVSMFALTDESIPNLVIAFIAQIMSAGWIFYRVASDNSARWIYDRVIVSGTCVGFDILNGPWEPFTFRVSLACSVVTLPVMFFFIFKLIKLYLKGTLSSVGSSSKMGRMAMWRLWMRILLQFTAFFAIASAAIWYDKRRTGLTAPYSISIVHDAGFYIIVVIFFLWLVLGMYSISSENRVLFLVYALLSLSLIIISVLWFGSALFRYEYSAWHTLAGVTTIGDALLVISCVLSLVCRLNFGRGLAQFLLVEHALRAAGFARDIFDGSSIKSLPSVVKRPPASPVKEIQPAFVDTSKSPQSATWLFSKGREGPGKCQRLTAEQLEERSRTSLIIISRESMGASDIETLRDDQSCDIISLEFRTLPELSDG